MIVQLTTAGQAALDANTGPVTITSFKIGSAYGYTPEASDTNIHGTTLFTGVPTAPLSVTSQVVKYGCFMDSTIGPFSWGELGLFMADGTLFALAVNSSLITKVTGDQGTRIDVYVSTVNVNYEMWLSLVEGNNPFRIAVLGAPDQLPQSQDASPNCYVISGFQDDTVAFMAYTNRSGWWSFDAYDFQSAEGTETVIQSVGQSSVSILNTDFQSWMSPADPGDVILEVVSGSAYSASRYVTGVVIGPSETTLNFNTSWSVPPVAGDSIVFFTRQKPYVVTLPIATTSVLGAVIIGSGLEITTQGVLSVSASQLGLVTSFNGMTGSVTYTISDQNTATGTSLITDSGSSTGLAKLRRIVAGNNVTINTDADNNLVVNAVVPTYTLPAATTSTLGGVIVGTGLQVTNTGVVSLNFTPVTGFNGQTGAATFELVNATGSTGQTLISDSGLNETEAKLYTIVAGTNISVTQTGTGDLTIASTYTLPVASTTVSGGVKVDGTTVTINAQGVISAQVPAVANASHTVTGIMRVGNTLEVSTDGTATVDYNLPIAGSGTGGVVGGVTVDGTTITVNAQGLISASSSVASVSGLTGTVVVQTTDASATTGTSLITSTGGPSSTSPGNAQLRRIAVGTGLAQSLDLNGNMVLDTNLAGTVKGQANANLMINESGDLQTTNATYLWTDSNSRTIALNKSTSIGCFWRAAAQTTAQSGTIQSPMFAIGARSTHCSQMIMRVDAAATGTFTYQVLYYNASGTLVTTGNLSSAVPLTNNLTYLYTAADTQDSTATQARVQINYTTATWTTLDWWRGKVEPGGVQSLYSMEGTIDALVSMIPAGYTLPAATTTTLGGVIVGSGLSVSSGTLSVNATQVVTSVSGQSGVVVVQTTNNNAATGVTLVADSGSTTGTAKLKTLVAGTNVTLGLDTNSNVVINAATTVPDFYDVQAGTPGTIASAQVLGLTAVVRTITFPANFAGSYARAVVAPATVSTTFTASSLNSDGSTTTLGTVTFAAGSNIGAFATTGGTAMTVSPNAIITVSAPSSPDASLSGVAITFLGGAV